MRRGWRAARKADERLEYASFAEKAMTKVFPDHWSFMLGEIALYAFIILVVTGIYLSLFFDTSEYLRPYHGSYTPLDGQQLSGAYASTVSLSWDVRGGLLVRQTHHWAAHIFIGAIVLHLCRIFFTGMFRRPRELNWTVGVTMLLLAIFNAFAGYSLPDDLLSGTGLHIFYSTLEGVPVVGAWLAFLTFGSTFPGAHIIGRLYILHVFVVPALLAVLIGAHLAMVVRQKHSQFPGPGRRDANVVGSRAWPSYAVRSLALLFAVAAVATLLGGLAQINPVWVWGDFKSAEILSPSVADWYIAWVEGALRLFPPFELHFWGMTVPNQFWPAVLMPGLTFVVLYAWPFIDRRLTGDRETHHLAARPRESPIRVAVGVWALTFYGLLLFAAGEELWVQWTGLTIATVRNTERVLVIVLPLLTAWIAWWVARALRRTARGGALELSTRELLAPRTSVEERPPEEADTERPLHELAPWLSGDGRDT